MMDAATAISVGALVVAPAAGIITAYLARKKTPEDRESIITSTVEKVLGLVNAQLDDCERTKREMKADFDAAKAKLAEELAALGTMTALDRIRITKLEAEVIRLGGDPSRINGGTR